MSTRYGGPNSVLYWKNNAVEACGLKISQEQKDKDFPKWLLQITFFMYVSTFVYVCKCI